MHSRIQVKGELKTLNWCDNMYVQGNIETIQLVYLTYKRNDTSDLFTWENIKHIRPCKKSMLELLHFDQFEVPKNPIKEYLSDNIAHTMFHCCHVWRME